MGKQHIIKIDTPRTIARMLTNHFEKRGKLTLSTLTGTVRGETVIVSNDPKAGYLLVDALPARLASVIEAARSIEVRGEFGIRETWFECNNLQVVVEGRDRYYELPYPKQLLQLQRRNAFRVGLPTRIPASVRGRASNVRNDSEITFFGRIENLSETGVAVVMRDSVAALMPAGTYVFDARIQIEKKLNIIVGAEVRNVRRATVTGEAIVGMLFNTITPSDAAAVARVILELQRTTRTAIED